MIFHGRTAHAKGIELQSKLAVSTATTTCQLLAHDHLDDLLAAIRLHFELKSDPPGLVTAHIDSAFRRIPLKLRHTWAAGVVYLHGRIVYVGFHFPSCTGSAI